MRPTHTRLTGGYCSECGASLEARTAYADEIGSEVECHICHVMLSPAEPGDIIEDRTDAQQAVWALVDGQAASELQECRRQLAETLAALRETQRRLDEVSRG